MAIIKGVTEGKFTNGTKFKPLLSELIDCSNYKRQIELNQKIKGLVDEEDVKVGVNVSEEAFASWFKCVCLKSRKIILNVPNGNTKTKHQLKICISSLSPAQRTFLARVMITADANDGNQKFLELVQALVTESLNN